MRRLKWILLTLLIINSFGPFGLVNAQAPWGPELVSPGNGQTADANPPTLCARNKGDPQGEAVRIRFEVHGGGEGDHISPWMDAGGVDNVICWTDTGTWTAEPHAWQARAIDSSNNQTGATPEWTVRVPAPAAPAPSCTIDALSVSPTAPQIVGTTVSVTASASCTNGVQALRFRINGNEFQVISGASGTISWNTSGYATTDHVITVEAADTVGGYVQTRSHTYTLTANPPPPPPSNENRSGGMDIGGYCRSLGYPEVSVDRSNPYSWSCKKDSSTRAIDMNALCQWQFNGQFPYPGLSNPNDAWTWSCNSQQVNPPAQTTTGSNSNGSSNGNNNPPPPPPSNENRSGGMDIGGYCRSLGYPEVSVDRSNPYSWSCKKDSSTRAIDMNALCQWQFNGQLPYPGLSNPNDAWTWSCNSQQVNRPSRTTTGTTEGGGVNPPNPSIPIDNGSSTPIGNTSLRIMTDILNIRNGPGINFDVIGKAARNGYFEITAGPQNNWYKIRFSRGEGWVSKDFVELPPPPPPPSIPQPGTVISCNKTQYIRMENGSGKSVRASEWTIEDIDGDPNDREVVFHFSVDSGREVAQVRWYSNNIAFRRIARNRWDSQLGVKQFCTSKWLVYADETAVNFAGGANIVSRGLWLWLKD